MKIAYLNGVYLPLHEARISPLDRGFLFGEGIYEVIPCHGGKPVGLLPHLSRMEAGLAQLEIRTGISTDQWTDIVDCLITRNEGEHLGIYIQVSRGADDKRTHAYPEALTPTVFAFGFEIDNPKPADRRKVRPCSAISCEDLRWKRCHIKSTSLLGNVMHFQQGYAAGNDECLLYNTREELTEGSASNVFIVKAGAVITPLLDKQILPGITRRLVIDSLRKEGNFSVEERIVTMDEVRNADEIWITSSTKEIAPVTTLDTHPVGSGAVGPIWEAAFKLYSENKFSI